MRPARPLSVGQRRLFEYLSSFCWDDYYFPMDGPYQNYGYFPEAGLAAVRACWRTTTRLMREGRAPRELGLYLHWPYCPSQCTYCFCSMAVPAGPGALRAAAAGLKREMDEVKDLFEDLSFGSLWLGGGTPTLAPAAELEGLLAHARTCFRFEPDAQIYVEASPATLTEEKAEVLRRQGVNRVTLGVQSLDEGVLSRVDRRGQSREGVERAYGWLRERGFFIDLDLMLGLEGQSRLSFLRDVAWALERGPSSLHLFAFDPRPQTLAARRGSLPSVLEPGEDRLVMELADRLVRQAGYRVCRLDPETQAPDCPEERQDSAVRRAGASVLGLGPSAVSHAFGAAWYCRPLVGEGGAAYRLLRSSLAEEERGFALRQLSLFGRLPFGAFERQFGRGPLASPGTGPGLRSLEASGLLELLPREARWTGRDPIEKLVALKRLYSPRVLRALLKGRKGAPARLGRRRAGAGGWDPAVRAKAESRGLFRVYFKGGPPLPVAAAPAGAEASS